MSIFSKAKTLKRKNLRHLIPVVILMAGACTKAEEHIPNDPKPSPRLLPTEKVVTATYIPTELAINPTATQSPEENPRSAIPTLVESTATEQSPAIVVATPIPSGDYWLNQYRGSSGRDVIDIQQTSDAGFIALLRGEKLLKLDASGTILWQKDMSRFSPSAVFEAQAGGYVVIGTHILVKFKPDGSLEWQMRYYREVEDGIWPDAPFNIVMDIKQDATGILALNNIGMVTRFDGDGKVTSQLAFDKRPPGGGLGSERVGWTDSFAVFAGGFEDRNQNWIERYSAQSGSWRASIIPEDDVPTLIPPYFIRGMRDGGALYASNLYYGGAPQLWLVRLTSSGQVAWQKTYRLIDPHSNINFLETADGGFLITAIRYLELGEDGWRPYLWVGLFDNSGVPLWSRLYGDGTTVPTINSIATLSDGGFVLAGGDLQFNGTNLVGQGSPMIFKINEQGEIPGCGLMGDGPKARLSIPDYSFDRQIIDPPGDIEAKVFEASDSPDIEVIEADLVAEQLCVAFEPE